jgi:bacterial/archaeal transporter family protein
MWVVLGLFSALFLGFYDIVRKKVLKDNAIIPVLFLASSTCGLLFVPLVVLSHFGIIQTGSVFYIMPVTPQMHALFFLKSLIVGSSWFFGYYALSNLPLTIVTPINSTGPMWTLVGALIIFGERFSGFQWIGIVVVLFFFYIFSLAGKHEGIVFSKNKWIYAVIAGTLLGAVSSLYDKYLFRHYDRMAVQAWYSIYFVPVFLPFLMIIWYPKRKNTVSFRWSRLIPIIGVALVISDFMYFYALSQKESLITILSVLRRSSVVVSFTAGAIFFSEQNLKRKSFALAGILIGVIAIIFGSVKF